MTLQGTPPTGSAYRFQDEAEGIELVNRRIAQIRQLRARIRQLAQAHMQTGTLSVADELSLNVFQLYKARFMLDALVAELDRLRDRREQLMKGATFPKVASATPNGSRSA